MSWIWAVDPAMDHNAFCFADLESDKLRLDTLKIRTKLREGERLALIRKAVLDFADAWYLELGRPERVYVEQPSGRFIKPQLYYAVGVIQVALFEVTRVPVVTIPPKLWKVEALGEGMGGATKERIMKWCLNKGYRPQTQDEADAMGIGIAGRKLYLRENLATKTRS